jgi:hypothetical protein
LSSILILLHIPKAAGTTLRWVLESNYPARSVLHCYGSRGCGWDQLANMPVATKARVSLLCSHLPFGTHSLFPQSSRYITMLREPVSRAASAYYAFNSSPDLDGLANFAANLKHRNRDNQQVRQVASVAVDAHVTDGDLQEAKRRLSNDFVAVGLAERFELSLALMQRVLDLQHVQYVNRNLGRHRPSRAHISPAILETLSAAHQYDLQLYKYAERLLEERAEEHQLVDNDIGGLLASRGWGRARIYASRGLRRLRRQR